MQTDGQGACQGAWGSELSADSLSQSNLGWEIGISIAVEDSADVRFAVALFLYHVNPASGAKPSRRGSRL